MVFQKGRHIRRYSPHIAWAGRAAEYAGIGRAAVKTRRGLRALESCVSCLSHQTPVIFFNFRLTSLPCNDINAVSVMVLAWDCKELTETFTQSKRKGRGLAPRAPPLAPAAPAAPRLFGVGLGVPFSLRAGLRLHLLRLRVVQQSVELLLLYAQPLELRLAELNVCDGVPAFAVVLFYKCAAQTAVPPFARRSLAASCVVSKVLRYYSKRARFSGFCAASGY